MRLIFLLFLSFIYDIRSEEINDEIDNRHLSTGAILRKQEGYAQSSSNGGTIAFFRSKPRIAAVRTFNIHSEEINDEIDNGHLSTGAILRKQEGYAQSSSNGGTIAFFRSKPRIAAVRTFSEGYVGGDRTPHLRETIHDGNYDHDLHTAYRLPLQRLSDQQLSMILKKHSPEIRDGGTH
uniref:Uncharacterized protein n=1 Tax=Panagrolaimus sp. PS1159 TaxID=55785 RepID=A0AC35F2A0_9BILA